MYIAQIASVLRRIPKRRVRSSIGSVGALLLSAACVPALAADAASAAPVKIAVFEFELEDVSAAGESATSETASDQVRMQAVTAEARRVLVQSGHYSLVDVSKVDAQPVKEKSLRNCDGCEAGIALQLGAEQAFVGVVRRISMTDYYVLIQLSDCRTGKVLDQQVANFAGGDDGWASGVRMLIKHTVLAADN
jgi:hypothetical protein